MGRFLLLLTMSFAMLACQNNTGGDNEVVNDSLGNDTKITGTTKAGIRTEECYRYTAVRDTYDIKISGNGNTVEGMMHFNNFQKDDSRGNFTGTFINDSIIKLVYRFESEGMKSVREIFLRDEGSQLVTGIGEEDVAGDSAFIKNPDKISFTGTVYKKVDCSEIK